jgi:hypothetical protein
MTRVTQIYAHLLLSESAQEIKSSLRFELCWSKLACSEKKDNKFTLVKAVQANQPSYVKSQGTFYVLLYIEAKRHSLRLLLKKKPLQWGWGRFSTHKNVKVKSLGIFVWNVS